jgi:hypothetical protein
MSYPQYTIATMGGLGWSFWPYGDVYSLVPKWHEWHSVTGRVIEPGEEQNRFELVARRDAQDAFFVVQVGDFTDPASPVIPVGTPAFSSRVWLPFGFYETKTLLPDWVQDDITGLWNGKVAVTIPLDVRQWIGEDQVAEFVIDWWPTDAVNDIHRFAHGTIVVRA